MKAKKQTFQKTLLLASASLGLVAAAPAQATLQLAFSVNGGPSTVVIDNVSPQDTNNALNIIDLPATLEIAPGLIVTGSTHSATLGPPQNILRSSSLSVDNNTGKPGNPNPAATYNVLATLSATDFVNDASDVIASASGTFENAIGSSVAVSFFNDPSNTQGAKLAGDTPGNSVYAPGAVSIIDAAQSAEFNSGLLTLGTPDLNPFSMTLQFAYTLTPGGSFLSRGQTEIKPVSTIPEPGSLLLLGAGLAGLISVRSRRAA